MIFDRVENVNHYKGISPALDRALEQLPVFTAKYSGPGRIEADGERLYANGARYLTSSDPARLFEAHKKYADIHVVLRGEELIQYADEAEAEPAKEYDEAIEAALYSAGGKSSVHMRPGCFVVFLPGEIHRAGTAVEEDAEVSKYIVKVLLET